MNNLKNIIENIAPASSQAIERREHLSTLPNPGRQTDYVVTLETGFRAKNNIQGGEVLLRYVPDQLIVSPLSFEKYIHALGTVEWSCLEEISTAILEDLNNELVPKWQRITICAKIGQGDGSGLSRWSTTVEDRQPRWDNERLLRNLESF